MATGPAKVIDNAIIGFMQATFAQQRLWCAVGLSLVRQKGGGTRQTGCRHLC